MHEPGNFSDSPSVYARAEPDDEYDRRPDPLDPYLVDRDEYDIEDEEELDDEEDED
jgi:hypothetical protein